MFSAIVRSVAVVAVAVSTLLPASDLQDSDNPPIRKCIIGDNNPYTGYVWKADKSICVPGLPTMRAWYMPSPDHTIGNAVFYAPYVMEATARYRRLDLSLFVDGVSLMSPSDIGRTVWLRRPGHGWEGPFLVVDSAARGDIYPVVVHRKEVVEVGFRTAARWGMVEAWPHNVLQYRIEDIEVIKADTLPEWANYHAPIRLADWWKERVEFSGGAHHDPSYPVAIKKTHEKFPGWIWRTSQDYTEWDYVNAYDDWYEYLFPGDPRFDFEEPERDKCVVLWRWSCPGPTPY